MSFLESTRFPVNISQYSTGGPGFSTGIVTLWSGQEDRNINWSTVRHRYDVAYGVKLTEDLEQVLSLFHITRGRAHGFRYKDWLDCKSCEAAGTPAATDQVLATGDGIEYEFQLVKSYDYGAESQSRDILKPVAGTVLVAVDGTPLSSGWSVDTATGMLTFTTTNHTIILTSDFSDWFAIDGDHASDFTAGDSVHVTGSEGGANDGVWTVSSAAYNATDDRTEISVTGEIPSGSVNTPEGFLRHGQPASGTTITAGFEFDVPVRFDVDELPVTLELITVGSVEIPLIEVRDT